MRVRSALFCLASVCWASVAFAQDVAEKPLEVIHGYVTESESAAFEVTRDRFLEEGGQWQDTAMSGGSAVRAATVRRILGGNPPGAAQNQNKNVYRELLENDLLKDITSVAEAEKWAEVLPPAVMDSITYEGEIIAAPHQTQVAGFLYATQETLDKLGVSMPTNFDEVFAAMDKAREAGLIPYAAVMETQDMRRLFAGTLASIAGPAIYNRVYVEHDPEAVKSPEFREAAETFRRLKSYSDSGWATREWNDSTALLVNGEAAFQITGDWGKGELIAAGLTPGTDFHCGLLGGNVVISGNVLIFPKIDDEAIRKQQDLLARVAMEPDVQLQFALKKGSIPTRTDVDTSSMDPCAQTAIKASKDPARAVLDDNYSVSPQTLGKIEDLVKSFWGTDNLTTDEFITRFAALIEEERS